MSTLIQRMQSDYLNNHDFLAALGREDICVLADFLDHQQVMSAFWHRFYSGDLPRQVICGLNPGRLGAGLTGVPFTDFQTLARWMPQIERQDTEPSAQFFAKVVDAIGVESFFQRFYVTNISAVGYVKDGRNLNYHDLPAEALEFVGRRFVEEMENVRPLRIIALGRQVERSIKKLLPEVSVTYLPHPAWVSTYRKSSQQDWIDLYLIKLSNV